MNKLEQQIYDNWKGKIPDFMFSHYDMEEVTSIAAKVCLEIAERAWKECEEEYSGIYPTKTFEDFKKEIL